MSCLFCNRKKFGIILENKLAIAIFDKYPVQQGHLLIIPKNHVMNYFDATTDQIMAIHELIKEGKKLIDKKFTPDRYNIGVNIGEYGGQTINHLHFHLIPRYKGDIEDTSGGIRRAIPNWWNIHKAERKLLMPVYNKLVRD